MYCQFIESKPDFNRLRMVLQRNGTPGRVPFFEIHGQLEDQVLRYLCSVDADFGPLYPFDPAIDDRENGIRRHLSYMYALGYDYCNITVKDSFYFEGPEHGVAGDGRTMIKGGDAIIASRADFDKYRWPDPDRVDYSAYIDERILAYLPGGMKSVVDIEGPFIIALYLLGYEGICYTLYDDIKLFEDIVNYAGERILEVFNRCASYDMVGAMLLADDIGYHAGTYLPPEVLRKYIFPWHKRIIAGCKKLGKPVILHACGNVEAVMEDIIDCGYDARHSFEDKITPVYEAKQKWGDRIAMLGGFDMHKLCTMTESEIREHARMLIDRCTLHGYAFGTGNSVANYIPVPNFLAMMDEGARYSTQARFSKSE